jgi:hypothetical protein
MSERASNRGEALVRPLMSGVAVEDWIQRAGGGAPRRAVPVLPGLSEPGAVGLDAPRGLRFRTPKLRSRGPA